MQSDERLLKLYESGLPAWAIYTPLYRMPYRPWMRTVSYCLFIAISIFSMVMGFYDLIKNVPLLHKVQNFHLACSMTLHQLLPSLFQRMLCHTSIALHYITLHYIWLFPAD